MISQEKENEVPAAARTIQTTSLNTKRPASHSRAASASSITPYTVSSSGASSSSLRLPSSSQTASFDDDSDGSLDMTTDYVLAMHDYDADASSGTCLSFKAGQVIRVFNRDNSGWWDGELDGKRGWFPSNYVSEDVTAANEEISPSKLVWPFNTWILRLLTICSRESEDDMLDLRLRPLPCPPCRGVPSVRTTLGALSKTSEKTLITTRMEPTVLQSLYPSSTDCLFFRVLCERIVSPTSSHQRLALSHVFGLSSQQRTH
jgi:hypothetical protein